MSAIKWMALHLQFFSRKVPTSSITSFKVFSKVALLVIAAFDASALTSPVVYDSCNSGPVQCCGALHAPGSTAATNVPARLVGAITAQVGVECNPISVLALGSGASWYVFSSSLSSCNHSTSS